MDKVAHACTLVLFLSSIASGGAPASPPEVVPNVDLSRYMGAWHEIATFPQWFQKGCTDSRAEYRLLDDGSVEVINSCLRNNAFRTVKGKARVVDRGTNAKLKVTFFWPIRGDYWIIELGKDYEYAVVSTPNRKYLWILSRSKTMDERVYAGIIGRLQERGFEISRLRRTIHGKRKE